MENAERLPNESFPKCDQSPTIKATPFEYRDPKLIPPRAWIYGHHLIRKNISVTVAPGGVGKSSLMIVQALELASGRALLGHFIPRPVKVWLFNLEDERSELDRRIAAAMSHYGILPEDIADRLFVDTGREQELILAAQERDSVSLNKAALCSLKEQIRLRQIDVLIVDPFVSSHRVNEMDNGKIDLVAKEWVRIAEECNCVIELVHHTRKLNGVEATSDASRGASSLTAAARSSRVLQRLSMEELEKSGVRQDDSTYFSVKRDKSNLASAGDRETYRTVSIDLGQGDQVGVVERWKKPDLFQGVGLDDLQRVQEAVGGLDRRYSCQASDWVGFLVAEVLGLDLPQNKKRIKSMIEQWLSSGALVKADKRFPNGRTSPVIEVGEWAISGP
ncbi:recombinase RecA [Marivita geojedonensis]|uniref:Recombinase RecA n=1 Tax=Marivita geojedonensis TaxID=1123756 RepID=A0A1X4NBF6_9RHOB|nr:recombinase RecA [Marivita geojedonensis]